MEGTALVGENDGCGTVGLRVGASEGVGVGRRSNGAPVGAGVAYVGESVGGGVA